MNFQRQTIQVCEDQLKMSDKIRGDTYLLKRQRDVLIIKTLFDLLPLLYYVYNTTSMKVQSKSRGDVGFPTTQKQNYPSIQGTCIHLLDDETSSVRNYTGKSQTIGPREHLKVPVGYCMCLQYDWRMNDPIRMTGVRHSEGRRRWARQTTNHLSESLLFRN